MSSRVRSFLQFALAFIAGAVAASVMIMLQLNLIDLNSLSGFEMSTKVVVEDRRLQIPSGLLLPPSIWENDEIRQGSCRIALPDKKDTKFFDNWRLPKLSQCEIGAGASKLEGDTLVELKGKCKGKLQYRAFDGVNLGLAKDWRDRVEIGDVEKVIVICDSDGRKFYDFHVRVKRDEKVIKRSVENRVEFEKQIDNKNHLSVVVLMVDSLTREHAIRVLPRTLDWMGRAQDYEMFDYTRFNTVGKGTKMNFTPVFFGNISADFVNSITFESLNMLYERAGFATAFIEESCINNTGSMGRIVKKKVKDKLTKEERIEFMKAFRDLSDHSLGNVFCEVMKMMKVQNFFSESTKQKICFAGELMHKFLLRYLSDFVDTYADDVGVFATLKTNEAHESSYSRVALLDSDLLEFVRDTMQKHPNLAIVLMGDHGIGYGELSETFTLTVEYNLPGLFMLLPKSYTRTIPPDMLTNLRENQNKLVTGLDLYATFADLAFYGSGENINGRSFMRPIGNATCTELNIPNARCSCSEFSNEPTEMKLWKVISRVLVEERVNRKVSMWKDCAQLKVDNIKEVRKVANQAAGSVVFQITAEVFPKLDSLRRGSTEEFVFEVEPKPTWTKPVKSKAVTGVRILGQYKRKGRSDFNMQGLFTGRPDDIIIEIDWSPNPPLPTRTVRLTFIDDVGNTAFTDTTKIEKNWLVSRSTIKGRFLKAGHYVFHVYDEKKNVLQGSAEMLILEKKISDDSLIEAYNTYYRTQSVTRQSSFSRFSVCLPDKAPADLCVCDIAA